MKLRYDRLFIAIFIGSFIISGILYLSSVLVINFLVEHSQNTHLNEHTEVLTVESIKYTSDTETSLEMPQNDKKRLCGLEVVTCKDEEVKTDEEIIKEISSKYEVDWKLIYSITKWETGNMTSRAYKELNNPGGWQYWSSESKSMVFYQFNSIEEGYEFMIKTLKNNYIDKGLTTIEEIGKIYCPVGINDKGQNQYWQEGVRKVYEQL